MSAQAIADLPPQPPAKNPGSPVVFALLLGLGGFVAAVILVAGNGKLPLAFAAPAMLGLFYAMARLPLKHTAMGVIFLMYIADYLPEGPQSGMWQSPFYPIGQFLFLNMSALTRVSALRFPGLDFTMLLLCGIALWRRFTRSTIDEPTGSVRTLDPCLTAPPALCVATTQYQYVFDLPPIAGGYTISYQRCCRTPAMVNLQGQQGITCTVHIPGRPYAVNSSARFSDYPPIALCMDQDMSFDHSATDPDGDQLVYSLSDPFQGADATMPAPLAPPPPYLLVNWAVGYSGANPLDSSPPIAIDATTGLLTVHPTLQGAFTVGVCVTEIRNGVVISEAKRDFMFKVAT